MKSGFLKTVTLLFFIALLVLVVLFKSGWFDKPKTALQPAENIAVATNSVDETMTTDTLARLESLQENTYPSNTKTPTPGKPDTKQLTKDTALRAAFTMQDDTTNSYNRQDSNIMLYGSKSAMMVTPEQIKKLQFKKLNIKPKRKS
jgi:hypothetical protein